MSRPQTERPIDQDVADAARGKFVPSAASVSSGHDFHKPWSARGPPEGIELERMLTMPEVSELTGLSPDSIKRHYGHLIRRMSPRRVAIKLRDALSIGATRLIEEGIDEAAAERDHRLRANADKRATKATAAEARS